MVVLYKKPVSLFPSIYRLQPPMEFLFDREIHCLFCSLGAAHPKSPGGGGSLQSPGWPWAPLLSPSRAARLSELCCNHQRFTGTFPLWNSSQIGGTFNTLLLNLRNLQGGWCACDGLLFGNWIVLLELLPICCFSFLFHPWCYFSKSDNSFQEPFLVK